MNCTAGAGETCDREDDFTNFRITNVSVKDNDRRMSCDSFCACCQTALLLEIDDEPQCNAFEVLLLSILAVLV